MRLPVIPGLCLAALAVAPAWADVKLTNKDSKAHDIIVKCGSTVQRSIQAGTTTSLGKGPCTVTVKATGASMSGSGNDTLVIPRRQLFNIRSSPEEAARHIAAEIARYTKLTKAIGLKVD